ncbi:MAG: 1-acyl-sn-glycerol-3-phosphate acyltransferase [Gammaproteobacteria bacterium]|nr:1-acyl-sn-glycerol-3-phosphate acyltransferase [Gammaproteobacteria bacterium]
MKHHFKPIRINWRFMLLMTHIFSGLLLAIFFLRNSNHPDTMAAKLTLWWHRRICRIFSVRVKTFGEISSTPCLFVINHISWFDIPALGSAVPVHFLSKDEVNSWPIIGWLANRAGTLFIKRGSRGAAEQSVGDICQALKAGGHVMIFPEGTTTDGTSVKRFHSRLLQAAIDAQVPIQPVALLYPHDEGVHPKAPFIGDTQLLRSTLDMMSESHIDTELHFLPCLDTDHYSRDQLASLSHDQILQIVKNFHTRAAQV